MDLLNLSTMTGCKSARLQIWTRIKNSPLKVATRVTCMLYYDKKGILLIY